MRMTPLQRIAWITQKIDRYAEERQRLVNELNATLPPSMRVTVAPPPVVPSLAPSDAEFITDPGIVTESLDPAASS